MSQGTRALAAMGVACGLIGGGMALAQGPDMNLPVFGITPGSISSYAPAMPSYNGETRAHYEDGGEAPRLAKPRGSTGSSAVFGYGKPICVRLCDGSFFPTASVDGGEAACAAQCPDAPTALYTMPTDRIEDAVSATGAPYTKLPVAKRYQTSFNTTCTCHRDTVAANPLRELMADTTLRRGDIVMTRDGFRVYQGEGYGPSSPRDFVALARARLPAAERIALLGMERARAGSRMLAAPAQVVARPRGHVTVDSGAPAR